MSRLRFNALSKLNVNVAPSFTLFADEFPKETDQMVMQKHAIVIWIVILLAFALGATRSAEADPSQVYHGHITVENVWTTSAVAGSWSKLHLRIINESPDHVHLLGVDSPVAMDARIVGRISSHGTTTLESVSVRADEELDLASDHMWIELGPMTREVKAGESIPIELVFVRSRIPLNAHVHGVGG